jgi:hypothetical protein
MKTIKILALLAALLASVFTKAADSSSPNPLGTVEDLLKQEHQHARSAVPPTSLAELESEHNEFAPKQPQIEMELFHKTVPRLAGITMAFEVLSGITLEKTRDLVEQMNDKIVGVVVTPK